MLYSEQSTILLARRHLNTMILTNLENLNSISYISQETHNFLALTDPVIVCIYWRITERHFPDHGNVLHPTSKLLKCDLVQKICLFRPFGTFLCGFLLSRRHLLFCVLLLQFMTAHQDIVADWWQLSQTYYQLRRSCRV